MWSTPEIRAAREVSTSAGAVMRRGAIRLSRGRIVVLLGVVSLVLAPAAGLAARAKPQPCSSGRFMVEGSRIVPGDDAIAVDMVALAGGRVSVASGCPAARARSRATATGTRLRARWMGCPGLTGRVTLKARLDALCTGMQGRLQARRFVRPFSAVRSRCGDGTVDGGAGEECEGTGACPDGSTCDVLTCRCGPSGPDAQRCTPAPGGGQAGTQAPVLVRTLADSWHEAWLGSPAVADLDRDGRNEIVVPRANRLVVWRPDGGIAWRADVAGGGRIWASPLVADFAGDAKLEVVVAARGQVAMYDAAGALAPGFPVAWRDEIRSLAAGDVDADGRPEIVAVTTRPLAASGQRDIIQVIRGDGTTQPGFPPNTTGTAGCDDACYVTGGYDQNVAVGPLDDDATFDIVAAQDNAYLSWHRGSGVAFEASPIFRGRTKVLGIRFLHDYALAQQGWADDEESADQAHFTNSAPAIADLDGDGVRELVVLGSVQNAAQTDRERGVALWVLNRDGTRPPAWTTPFHVPAYLAGLWDFDGTNVVAATNQVSVADLDPAVAGLDMVFAGFDGRIHAVGADRSERWSHQYTTAATVLTGGVAIADLSGDGMPEVVFATYSTVAGAAGLSILDAHGVLQQQVGLPGRGAMPVPTIADVDGDGTLEIVVSLKDGEEGERAVLVYTVPGSSGGCLLWPTGRGNDLRNGFVRGRARP